jgi:hypothetical protein
MNESRRSPELKDLQYAFAAHIRDPEGAPAPSDVEDRRMAIYRDLFYNNLEGFAASNFPVLRSLTPDDRWHGMVRDFMVRHRCSTPLFAEIAQEFLAYLQAERDPHPDDPPFLLELAHYEWVELAVAINDDPSPAVDPNGDLLEGIPVVAPSVWNLSYRFPVHRIGPDHQPDEPGDQPTHLVVYRDRSDDVHFLEINAVTQRLLQLMKETDDRTGLDILKIIASELHAPDPDTVIQAGVGLLADLKARNILLGTRAP